MEFHEKLRELRKSRGLTQEEQNLQTLMTKVYRKPVVVTDPTPKGAHYDENK